MLVKKGTHRVSGELHTRATGNTDLDGPGCAVGLGRAGSRGTRWGWLEEGGKGGAVVGGCHHGDGSAKRGAYRDGAETAVRGGAGVVITLLTESDETAAKEPRPDGRRKAAGEEEADEAPQGVAATTRDKGTAGAEWLAREGG